MIITATTQEATILESAQDFVDRWLRSPSRRPFVEAVVREERKLYPDDAAMRQDREAFRKTANAIRVGYGHVSANPGPLLEIARRALRD